MYGFHGPVDHMMVHVRLVHYRTGDTIRVVRPVDACVSELADIVARHYHYLFDVPYLKVLVYSWHIGGPFSGWDLLSTSPLVRIGPMWDVVWREGVGAVLAWKFASTTVAWDDAATAPAAIMRDVSMLLIPPRLRLTMGPPGLIYGMARNSNGVPFPRWQRQCDCLPCVPPQAILPLVGSGAVDVVTATRLGMAAFLFMSASI